MWILVILNTVIACTCTLVIRILYAPILLFYSYLLLHRFTRMHAMIVFVFPLYWTLFMLYGLLLHEYSCILVTWLFPVTDTDIPVTGHVSCWYAMCEISHLLFPVFSYLVSCYHSAHVLLLCYMYHVRDLFRIYCVVRDNKYNLGMGETWRLTRSCRVDVWIHCLFHCRGQGSADYRQL